jgi:hypothetical protein
MVAPAINLPIVRRVYPVITRSTATATIQTHRGKIQAIIPEGWVEKILAIQHAHTGHRPQSNVDAVSIRGRIETVSAHIATFSDSIPVVHARAVITSAAA